MGYFRSVIDPELGLSWLTQGQPSGEVHTDIDPNVVIGRFALGETASSSTSAAYLNADQRGGTASNGKPSLTIDEAAVQLTRDQASWGDYWGDSATVTFAFRSSAPQDMPDDTSGFSRFSATQINATLLALQSWSDVANITFNRVGSGSSGSGAYSNSATILFGNYSSGSEGAAAFAYYPYSYAYSAVDGDVWVNNSLSYNANPQLFNYGQLVLIHEIGHAIGLSHPADYNAGPDQDITYAQHATYFEDSMQYTVMSYFYETYTGASYGSPYPATVMLDDIAAAQRLYGANMTTRTGNTVYGFNATADRPWFSTTSSSSPLIFAVWDAGGTDTFDFSGYSSAARIELREGYFSDVGGLTGNIAVAKGVVIENAIGGNGADRITGNAAANRLQGNAGADTLTGLGGADVFVLTTGGGADTISDFVVGTDKLDVSAFGGYLSIVQNGADTIVNVSSTVSVRLTNVTASSVTDASFVGLAGAPPPPPTPPAGTTLNGGSGADTLTGGAGDDFLYGLGGADTLDGGAGADAMQGGAGDDLYYVDNAGDQVVEGVGEGADMVYASVSWTLGANVEDLRLTGSDGLSGAGNALANRLFGNAAANALQGGGGDDWLDGGAGADAMSGGAGNDLYFIDNAADQAIENAGEGVDMAYAYVSYTLGANVEEMRLMGSATLNGAGNSLANSIYGNAGANDLSGGGGGDRLEGGDGADRLDGGAGSDALYGGAGADVFVIAQGGGADTVGDFAVGTDKIDISAFGSYLKLAQDGADTLITLADGVTVRLQNIAAASLTTSTFIGMTSPPPSSVTTLNGTSGADTLTGGAGDDFLYGLGGADTLDGRAGADTMSGGAGDDYYYVDNAGDQVVEGVGEGADMVAASISWTLGANVEDLRLTGTEGLSGTGNALANRLFGNAGANILNAGDGSDWLDGGAGADAMSGGAGADLYFVDHTEDRAIENAGEGVDMVYAYVSYTLGANVEEMRLLGSALNGAGNSLANNIYGNAAANQLFGNAGADRLYGGDGNDWLDGGAGADGLYGGAGHDLFLVDDTADQVIENAGEGTDMVYAWADFTLGANVEEMRLMGSAAINGAGNALGNSLYGNSAANELVGNGGGDVLDGGDGADRLDGGAGADVLTGGGGADHFLFNALSDSTSTAMDRVTDFDALTDVIDLRGLDANTAMAGDQGFAWASAFSGQAGQATLTYNASAGVTILGLDANGDGLADFQLQINGHVFGDSGFLL